MACFDDTIIIVVWDKYENLNILWKLSKKASEIHFPHNVVLFGYHGNRKTNKQPCICHLYLPSWIYVWEHRWPIKRGIFFLYLKDLYRMFLCKVMLKELKMNMQKIEQKNNKMAAMMEFWWPDWKYTAIYADVTFSRLPF